MNHRIAPSRNLDGRTGLPARKLLSNSGEIKMRCPVCQELAKVGGPVKGWWTLQPHLAKNPANSNDMCAGDGERIQDLP